MSSISSRGFIFEILNRRWAVGLDLSFFPKGFACWWNRLGENGPSLLKMILQSNSVSFSRTKSADDRSARFLVLTEFHWHQNSYLRAKYGVMMFLKCLIPNNDGEWKIRLLPLHIRLQHNFKVFYSEKLICSNII